MAGEVLRRRVEDDVRAEVQRPLEDRRRERVVDDDERPRAVPEPLARATPRGALDVDDLEQRVRRRLEPDEPRPLGERLPHRLGIGGEVRVARDDAVRAADALEVAERAAVDVVADDDLGLRPGQLGDRRGGGRAGGERDPLAATLERGDGALEPVARRVLRARVVVVVDRLPDAVAGAYVEVW